MKTKRGLGLENFETHGEHLEQGMEESGGPSRRESCMNRKRNGVEGMVK